MKLEHKKYEIIHIEYDDLENLIENTYGHEFCVASTEEIGNDSYQLYTVDGELSDYAQNSVKEFIEDGSSCSTRYILNDMCKNGVIEEGKYLLEVSW